MDNKNLKSKKYRLKPIWIKIWIKKFLEKEDTKNVNEGGKTHLHMVEIYDEEGNDLSYVEKTTPFHHYDEQKYVHCKNFILHEKLEYFIDISTTTNKINTIQNLVTNIYNGDNNFSDVSYTTKNPQINYIMISLLMV